MTTQSQPDRNWSEGVLLWYATVKGISRVRVFEKPSIWKHSVEVEVVNCWNRCDKTILADVRFLADDRAHACDMVAYLLEVEAVSNKTQADKYRELAKQEREQRVNINNLMCG